MIRSFVICIPCGHVKNEMAGHVVYMEEMRNSYKILVRKPEGKRPPGRCRHRLKDNTKMDFKEVGCKGVDWIHRAAVKAVMISCHKHRIS
jgi:hypothetical protein